MTKARSPFPLIDLVPAAFAAVDSLHGTVHQAAVDAGLEPLLLELVRLRCSQINGCAHCIALHTTAALREGEREDRLARLVAWRDSELFTERERAALALAEAVTLVHDGNARPQPHREAGPALDEEGPAQSQAGAGPSQAEAGPSQAEAALSEAEAALVAWAATVANTYNRIAITSRPLAREDVTVPAGA